MTKSASAIVANLLVIGSVFLTPLVGNCYDTPDFEKSAFSRDGIFLPDNQKDSILGALASLASNFPDSTRVDEDLKEKAIAIALNLDPMNFAARKTHATLSRNELPARTPYFDSLSAISESLWSGAETLLQEPVEPENATLAAYLIEISLLTHPDPPQERLVTFAEITGKNPLPWDDFVELQTESNQSTRRAGDIFLNLEKIASRGPGPRPGDPRKPSEPTFFGSSENRESAMEPAADFTPVTKEIFCVLYAEAVDGKPMAGKLIMEARRPTESETVPSGDGLPFVTKRADGVTLAGLENSNASGSVRDWQWPAGVIGLLDFETRETAPGPARVTSVGVLLCSMILAESTLKGIDINQEIVLAGNLPSPDSEAQLQGELLPTIETAAKLEKPYLAVPESEYSKLVDYLVETEQLSILFAIELVSYGDLEEAVAIMTRPVPDALSEASQAFSEIEAVSSRMPFVDLARNAKVQERLEGILTAFPQHMSARAMLEFGRTPVGGMSTAPADSSSISDRIDATIRPFLQLEENSHDINELRNALEDSQLALSRLRTELTLEARDYHSLAEDFLEAAEMYISLTNQTTSTAQQRLRETRQALAELETERRVLGLGEFE